MGNNRNWDGTCNARVRKITIGWTIEIEYPFSTLNFDRNAPAWGVNSQRTIRRKNEENVWTGHLRNQGLRRMSNAGLLVGIRDVNQGLGLNFPSTPQPTSRTLRAGKIPQPLQGTDNVGLGLFYNFTPSLRGNLIINTDFAETKVDQRFVNPTRFPLFFPEKRTFFLDGATFFDFYRGRGRGGGVGGPSPVRSFFSRRIGRDDQACNSRSMSAPRSGWAAGGRCALPSGADPSTPAVRPTAPSVRSPRHPSAGVSDESVRGRVP